MLKNFFETLGAGSGAPAGPWGARASKILYRLMHAVVSWPRQHYLVMVGACSMMH